jgi:hypothetical protein
LKRKPTRAEINARIDRIADKLEPLFDNGDLDNVETSADDRIALFALGTAFFGRWTHGLGDFTDEILTELERAASRLVELAQTSKTQK